MKNKSIKSNNNEEKIWKYNYKIHINNKNAPNVVFIHGFNSSHSGFWSTFKQMQNVNYYSFTFPGNNLTHAYDYQLNTLAYAKLVIRFIKKFQISNPILVGHSMGGGIALIVNKLAPKLAKKIVCVAPMNYTSQVLKQDFFDFFFPKNIQEYQKYLAFLLYDKSKVEDESFIEKFSPFFSYELYNNPSILKLGKYLPTNENMNLLRRSIKTVNVPCLLILGQEDRIVVKQATIDHFKENIPHVQVEVIPNTSHIIFEEQPKLVIEILNKFIFS